MKTTKANKDSAAYQSLKRIRKQLSAPSVETERAESPVAPVQKTNEFKQLLNSGFSARSKTGTLSADDKALFKQAVKGVTPLKASLRLGASVKTKHQAEHYQRKRQHALGFQELGAIHHTSDLYRPESDEFLVDYLSPHCGTDVLKHLKKGRWPIVNSIDLHGATLDQARLRLDYFLQHSLAEQFKCIRIVHGKGYGSKANGPVLPATVRHWLSQLDFVLAFTDCAPNEGGSGAVKLVLRTTPSY